MRSDTQGADIFMFYRHYNSCGGGGGISFLFEFFYYPRVITEHKHPTHRHAQKDKHIKTKEWELTSTTSLDLSHYAQQRAALDWQGQARGPVLFKGTADLKQTASNKQREAVVHL